MKLLETCQPKYGHNVVVELGMQKTLATIHPGPMVRLIGKLIWTNLKILNHLQVFMQQVPIFIRLTNASYLIYFPGEWYIRIDTKGHFAETRYSCVFRLWTQLNSWSIWRRLSTEVLTNDNVSFIWTTFRSLNI